jgi:hypothetical protein
MLPMCILASASCRMRADASNGHIVSLRAVVYSICFLVAYAEATTESYGSSGVEWRRQLTGQSLWNTLRKLLQLATNHAVA